MKEDNERITIISLHKSGMKNADIVKVTGYGKMKVKRAVERFHELGTSEDRHRSGRPATAVTPKNVNKLRCRIRRNPERSMREMSKELNISRERVQFIIRKKLNMHSYKFCRGHYLSEASKINRLQKARKMLRLVGAGRLQKVLFTDEKIFTVERAHNPQNDRQLLKKHGRNYYTAKIITRRHFPASVMVWGGICASGKTPLVFIDKKVKINAAVYQEIILRNVLQPWVIKHFDGHQFVLQQDWAPAHSAKTTICLCENLFPGFWGKDVWPSNSPDLNAMDYSVWSILEKKISRIQYKSIDHLKVALRRAWDEITIQECATIVSNFPKRLKNCIKSKGANFEHLL